jgi:hypothetical protein
MNILWAFAGLPAKISGLLAVVVTAVVLQIPGPVFFNNTMILYENEQWEGRQIMEISPQLLAAIESEDTTVDYYRRQLARLRTVQNDPALNMSYTEVTRSDGFLVATAVGTGTGFNKLNDLFFDGRADITVTVPNPTTTQRQVSIFVGNRNPGEIQTAGGSESYRITGQQIILANADQVQLFNTALWTNPFEISVTLTENPGAPTNILSGSNTGTAQPGAGAAPPIHPGLPAAEPEPPGVNVIRNGDFEIPWPEREATAPEWEGYDNGRAHFAWYEELWPEAVHRGARSQLMEIWEHEPNVLDRVITIQQTVNVVPNSEYYLRLYAILRTDADPELRNQNEIEMHWGIDPFGEGRYENVVTWVPMGLTEQNRLGSTAEYPDDLPLVYEKITSTVTISDSNRVTLFIRGLKKFPNNVEVNMNIDDVELIGPDPAAPVVVIQAAPATEIDEAQSEDTPTEADTGLPSSGSVLTRSASVGMVFLGGLVLIIAGTAAVVALTGYRKET